MIKMPSETWSLSPKRTFVSSEPGADLYDRLPYQRNYNMCNEEHVAMESGNIVKFYDCKESRKNYKIPNKDDEFIEMLAARQSKTEAIDKKDDKEL